MLQDAREGDNLTASLINTITDNLVVGVIGRSNALQRLVLVSLLHTQVQNVKAIVYFEVVAHMRHVKCIETGLRFLESGIHFRSLQHLMGMIGRHTKCLATVNNIFS